MSAMLFAYGAGVVLLVVMSVILLMIVRSQGQPRPSIGAVPHVPLARNFRPKERERIIKEVRDCFAKGREYHIWRTGPTPQEAEQNLKEELEARMLIFPPELHVQSVVYHVNYPEHRAGSFEAEALLIFSTRQSVA